MAAIPSGKSMLHDIGNELVDDYSQRLDLPGVQVHVADLGLYRHPGGVWETGNNLADQVRQVVHERYRKEVVRFIELLVQQSHALDASFGRLERLDRVRITDRVGLEIE